MEITLDQLREIYPGYVPSKGCLYVIADCEVVTITNNEGVTSVYDGFIKDPLDPEGYRRRLNFVNTFDKYFSRKDLTPRQNIARIYDKYWDLPYWFNPDNPLSDRAASTH